MAVSDTNRLYSLRWFANPVFKEDVPAGMWADEHGWPVHGPLVWDAHVTPNRGWAIGRRTRSFVLFEDIAGRTFDGGGGLSTYYVLSHTIGGPDRSTFVAETMQVSADTIFVINAYGELRTRMVDFDTDGSDTMFFVYSYDRRDPRPDAIAIPAEDWFAHKPIPLHRRAQISTQLAIVLTGKHNRDRELRCWDRRCARITTSGSLRATTASPWIPRACSILPTPIRRRAEPRPVRRCPPDGRA